jgi:hypothetical protein
MWLPPIPILALGGLAVLVLVVRCWWGLGLALGLGFGSRRLSGFAFAFFQNLSCCLFLLLRQQGGAGQPNGTAVPAPPNPAAGLAQRCAGTAFIRRFAHFARQ